MRKELLDALKTKYMGVSEKILGRIADNLAKTVTTQEQVATAVEGVTFQQILDSYGDSRATEATQTAVNNYEKKHGLKDGKKVKVEPEANPDDDESNHDDIPSWAKALMESNEALAKKLTAIEGEKQANSRKSTLDGVLKHAPETIRQRYEKDFARMTFKDDEDFNGWIGEITPDVEKIASDFQAKGGVVGRPKSGGTGKGEEKNPYLESRIKEREAATTAPAIQGLTN